MKQPDAIWDHITARGGISLLELGFTAKIQLAPLKLNFYCENGTFTTKIQF